MAGVVGRATGRDIGPLALAYSPGGLAGMRMVALCLSLEPGIVVVTHLARVAPILLFAPFAFQPEKPS